MADESTDLAGTKTPSSAFIAPRRPSDRTRTDRRKTGGDTLLRRTTIR